MDRRVWAFLVASSLAGCGQQGTTIITLKQKANSDPAPAEANAAAFAAKELIAKLRDGTVTADQVTDRFKAVIGEPLTAAEREKGFSDAAATDWLKAMGTRLNSNAFVAVSTGQFDLSQGTLRLVNEDAKWRIDWFHVGRPKGVVPFGPDHPQKRFAVASFLDPLFTNNWELSEAALTDDAKKALGPALGSDLRGYNRGTLRSKFRGLLNGATGYEVTIAGDRATVTLTGPVERKLTLSLTEGLRPGVWLVNGID